MQYVYLQLLLYDTYGHVYMCVYIYIYIYIMMYGFVQKCEILIILKHTHP